MCSDAFCPVGQGLGAGCPKGGDSRKEGEGTRVANLKRTDGGQWELMGMHPEPLPPLVEKQGR